MPPTKLKDRLANSKTSRPIIDHLKGNETELELYIEVLLNKREIYYNQADLIIEDYWKNKNESIEKINVLKHNHQNIN